MSAAWAGHADVVTNLLKERATVNAMAPRGMTALAYASMNGHREVVRILLLGNADPNARSDARDSSALHYAASRGDVDVAQLLIESDAEVNARGGFEWTPLLYAASGGYLPAVELLLKKRG